MADLRYPIGKFEWIPPENEAQMAKRRVHYIDVLAKLPDDMRAAVQGLERASNSILRIVLRVGPSGRWCIMCPTVT